MIELRPSTAHAVSIVQPINAPAVRVVEGEGIFDPMRPALRRLDRLDHDLDPIAAGKLKLEPVKAQQHLKFVIQSETSYQDFMTRRQARRRRPTSGVMV